MASREVALSEGRIRDKILEAFAGWMEEVVGMVSATVFAIIWDKMPRKNNIDVGKSPAVGGCIVHVVC